MRMRNATSPLDRPFLTRTAEHALRAVLFLSRAGRQGPVSADQVASALGTPPNYTAKTLERLARRGLLRSRRGPHGGFELGVDPAEVSLATLTDVIDDAPPRTAVCLLGDRTCDAARPCAAHRRWLEVQARARALMEQTTVADLLGESQDGGSHA
jgi:Rrf2 family iron-sulfur cluster assembly transcriptional regulator